jgi:hypothetical protein
LEDKFTLSGYAKHLKAKKKRKRKKGFMQVHDRQ